MEILFLTWLFHVNLLLDCNILITENSVRGVPLLDGNLVVWHAGYFLMVWDFTEGGSSFVCAISIILHVSWILEDGDAWNRCWGLWWLDPTVSFLTHPWFGVSMCWRSCYMRILSQLLRLELRFFESLIITKDIWTVLWSSSSFGLKSSHMVCYVNVFFGGMVVVLLFRVWIPNRLLSWFILFSMRPEFLNVHLLLGLHDACSNHFGVVLNDPFSSFHSGCRESSLSLWFGTVDIFGAHKARLLMVWLMISEIHYFEYDFSNFINY